MAFDLLAWIIHYKYILLFYLILALILYWKRKKLDVQGKVIILYRMKWGLGWMDKYSAKFREWVILLGYIGIGTWPIAVILLTYELMVTLYRLVMVPGTVSGVQLVLPGTNIPGIGVLPFWYWIIAIFIIAVVHE